ncbi:MAG: signal peptidase II [Bacilli bacterium]|nr:signal peptidase II [Bacilli bacterium]
MKKLKVVWTKQLIIGLSVAVALIAVDFATKWIVQSLVPLGEPIAVIPNFFYINKSYNIAIAFSLGNQLGVWGRVLNISISVIMSVVIFFYWLTHDHKFRPLERITAILLGAGAVGNLIDRAFYWEGTTGFNGVIDFLQFYLGGGPDKPTNFVNPFATFNFADACLTIGIVVLLIILIIDAVKGDDKSLREDPRLAKLKKQQEEKDNNNPTIQETSEIEDSKGGDA